MSPSPGWYPARDVRGDNAWHRESEVLVDGEPSFTRASVWQNNGLWEMHVKEGLSKTWVSQYIGKPDSLEEALSRAEDVFQEFEERHRTFEAVRSVVELANEVEDRSPDEQRAIDRLTRALEQGSFEQSLDRSLDRDGRHR